MQKRRNKITRTLQKYLQLLLLITLGFGLLACQKQAPTPPIQKSFSAYSPFQQNRTDWPTQTWRLSSPETVGMDSKKLQKVAEYVFTQSGNEKDRKGIRSDGLVVIYKGQLVFEKYARGYKAQTPHLTWSASKSFVNALFGIAIKKGLFKLDDPAHLYEPLLSTKKGGKNKITIRHLLNMSPGLHWSEGYEASPLKSTVIAMLYTSGRHDMAQFTAKQPMIYPPGRFWYYSSGFTNLLMGILKKKLGAKENAAFPWKELFDPIGIKSVTWERDNSGTFVGSSYLHATPRDMARFGYLYLNDGVWDGKRILPKGWVKFSTTLPSSDQKGIYGAHWWLNTGRPELKIPRRWPNAPRDTFVASGHWGQYIFVIPSLDLVVVRTGDDRDHSFDRNKLLKLIIASIKKDEAVASPEITTPPELPSNTEPLQKKNPTPTKTETHNKNGGSK